ncbi:FAD-dependent oxidoreductase [Oleiharenicola lentus]|uniref:FAD-dependent oxidoreductase n=1 Tax=Oleiharenicola lentus TaxID=2508720 RepID=UPI003F66FD64
MILEPAVSERKLKLVSTVSDLVVVGGGLAGTCAAIVAARAGLRVTLVQDRPVLGGNSSSEVRLWVLGATSHLGNNNRWSREGGLIDELLLENQFRNPEGNALIWDSILLEKAVAESRLTLLLNTAVHEVRKSGPDAISGVRAFCSQNSISYELSAPLFVDASGDGIVGFLAGAAFRMGAESSQEFGEGFAPREAGTDLLGHSVYFYSKDVGRPVAFVPPSFALRDITRVPRYRDFNAADYGCRLWWIEYGGKRDTVHETEEIKWELWRVAYGVWDYIKNSGRFPEAANLTLEWVGTIPGKRESRRFEGDYILTQQDIVEQRLHADAVSAGGWAVDLHPPEGVFSAQPGCQQWHAKGVYQIPYRCLYSRNINNLFLGGRIISASHIAFGSTRVMATCAHNGQAIGLAAALCVKHVVAPRAIAQGELLEELRTELLRTGQFIPGAVLSDPVDLTRHASIHASSEFRLGELMAGKERVALNFARAMLLPLSAGRCPKFTFVVDVAVATTIEFELRTAKRVGNFTPDLTLASRSISVETGRAQSVAVTFDVSIDQARYVFVCAAANPAVQIHLSDARLTGVLSVAQSFNKSVGKSPRQEPPAGAGFDSFEFWLPARRPGGKNFALKVEPPLRAFDSESVRNGIDRPTNAVNAWLASLDDRRPELILKWPEPVRVARVVLRFDSDFDHPLESVLMGNPERIAPFCVPEFTVHDDGGRLLAHAQGNHLSQRELILESPALVRGITIRLSPPSTGVPAALFAVRCYAE